LAKTSASSIFVPPLGFRHIDAVRCLGHEIWHIFRVLCAEAIADRELTGLPVETT